MTTKIIDIRVDTAESDILSDIKKGLRPKDGGEKRLPTLLLYDAPGLRLFERITFLEEYYPTNAEIEVLEAYADQIAQRIPSGSILVELGSGNLRKVNILLQAVDRLDKAIEYYAVDLSLPELERTFSEIPTEGYKHVKCFGLYGTYDNALEWLKSPEIEAKPKTILWLGSSLGNFKRHEVAPFLAGFGDVLRASDTMLIGIDSCKEPERVFHAYNDRDNVTHEFILNGLEHANELMGETAFNLQDWEVVGEYDEEAGRHQAFVSPRKDVVVDGVPISQGERVRIEESYKYSREEVTKLWEGARLAENSVWANSRADYGQLDHHSDCVKFLTSLGLHLVSKPVIFFPTKPKEYAAEPVPSLSEWKDLWAAWDAVTRQMIPEEELVSKPINLRNACIFYLGHIPTFLDIHLARATDGKPSDPAYFWSMFERGIDPDVEDPTQCHAHSEIPDEWPPLADILKHQETVRERTRALYTPGEADFDGRVSRALWLGFEHEAMHLETLLYMLVQSDRVLPPPGTTVPDFAALAKQAETLAVDNEWFTIPASDIEMGLDDSDSDYTTKRYFGWDIEKPLRSAHVKSFRAKARPITNGDYAAYLAKTGKSEIPASWCSQSASKRDSVVTGHQNGANGTSQSLTEGKYVRTVYGTIPLKLAKGWPVVASYDELAGCAQWMGGRIPTVEEVQSIYKYVDDMKTLDFEQSLGNTIPAVNGHLINNGVDESPPSHALSNGNFSAATSLNPHDHFIGLGGSNVGFKHWHPVSVVEKGDKLCGQSDLGGVWEWTSTVLEKHEGFQPMELYPGYTADFFDGKHNITLGGSWATHPRIAGRKTFVNWYQRNYPHPSIHLHRASSAPPALREPSQSWVVEISFTAAMRNYCLSRCVLDPPEHLRNIISPPASLPNDRALTQPNLHGKSTGPNTQATWSTGYSLGGRTRRRLSTTADFASDPLAILARELRVSVLMLNAMFMRLRGHTCTYCLSIDEAHYKRHKDLADHLSSIYESCGNGDWTIIPSETEERGRSAAFDFDSADSGEVDRSLTPEETPSSKREKKDAKRLAKAASRSRVITQDDIRYVDSVLHSADGVTGSDGDGPRNPEEIEEIEHHLRYNAHVYSTQPNRRELKRFAQLPDADVDFDAEMERILETFRVIELIKRNTKNRGLQGKELKTFQTLVDGFKKAIVEDLVLVKKDVLEIRMRRAGYLRYTNKTAYGIVEDRYSDKNWKTGEKFTSSSSDSSGVMSPVEESGGLQSKQQESPLPQPPPPTDRPDRRHLESIHKRINGDDGLYDPVIEPYRAPLLSLLPDPTPWKKPVSLKVVATEAPEIKSGVMNAWGKVDARAQHLEGWQTVSHSKKPTAMVVQPSWGERPFAGSSRAHHSGANRTPTDRAELSSSTQTKGNDRSPEARAVRPPAATAVTGSNEPERFLAPANEPVNDLTDGHPVVSQKKKAKKAREAKRKAKKSVVQEEVASTLVVRGDSLDDTTDDVDMISSNVSTWSIADSEDAQEPKIPGVSISYGEQIAHKLRTVEVVRQEVFESQALKALSPPASCTNLAITKHGKHMHWIKFTRNFVVDQLTSPFLSSWSGCSHGTTCAFESNGVPDCPFHTPHCSCVDPLKDMCYLVYPCDDLCSSGPYNRLRGEKLMDMYEKDSRTKGRLMLVDEDLISYFMEDPSSRARNRDLSAVPERLAAEYIGCADGYIPGPLMGQERQFEHLWNKNKVIKEQISRNMLQAIQRQKFERPGAEYMCYCQENVPEEGLATKNVITCSHRDCDVVYFHKSCVKNLGVDKVSLWFCTSCEKRMKVLAHQTLRNLGYTDVTEEDSNTNFDEKKFKEMLKIPDSAMSKLKERVGHTTGKLAGFGMMTFEVDEGGRMTTKASQRF
ncbi:uncharacterized protein K460DRAFT_399093 [Cucurbitaria berberidis CBS 394.84]|uniref:Histidine-specific methyltransferase SAM-dependent domain-containing protein n=1 Tax=Cucurbitaria berberidis CBS 394.84 TaxID=1168544 RepID=A0A9P4L4B0_9PLEO|nr:uncharacterized protein K460DRAFT_399093 [Cucurbitaria berberidis CBS 394.84]KAF1841280.1 hypothetical protein K460DRAFT_399093 [Cucurbitaria berberidis CBS 394.84]